MDSAKYERVKNEQSAIYLKREKSERTWISTAYYHSSMEFCLHVKGKVICHVNGAICVLQEGEIIAIEGLKVHYFELEQGSEYMAFRVGNDYMQDFYKIYEREGQRPMFPLRMQNEQANQEIRDILNLFLDKYETCNQLQCQAYVNLILGTITAHYPVTYDTDKSHTFEKEILQYLQDNIKKEITLEQMAKHFGYSKNAFSRKVHSLIGQDLRTYLNCLRVKHVLYLRKMDPSLTVTAAATASGFKSMKTFYRAYAKYKEMQQEEFY